MSSDRFDGHLRFPAIHAKWILWTFLLVSVAADVSIVAAPLTIPSGTISGLYGGANRVDYAGLWATLPPVQSIVYYLGDIECHQISSRTIYLNGNEMPVCARDASLFLFLSVGLMIAAVVKPEISVSRMFLSLFPTGMRSRLEKGNRPVFFTWLVSLLCLAPIALDGGLQLVTPYESTNALRFITGIPSGIVIGLILGLMTQSMQLPTATRRGTAYEIPPPS